MEYNSEKAVDNLHQEQKNILTLKSLRPQFLELKKLKALKKEIQKREKRHLRCAEERLK